MNYFSTFSRFFLIFFLSNFFYQCSPAEKAPSQSKKKEKETTSSKTETRDSTDLESIAATQSLKKESILIQGHFIYFADSHVFFPCGEKKGIPIIPNKQRLLMEEAYLNLPNLKTAEKAFLQIEGNYITAKNMENVDKKQIEVTRFIGFEKESDCGR